MENLDTIHTNVRLLLTKYPEFRSPFLRKQAHFRYWQEFDGTGEFGITEKEYCRATSAETISRAIRKIQDQYPDLRPTKEQQIKKYEMANDYRVRYSRQTK